MKRYLIISEADIAIIEQRINELLNDGWKTAGGVSVAYKHEHLGHGERGHIPGRLVYSQAMEKEG